MDFYIGDNTAISRFHANIITKENQYFYFPNTPEGIRGRKNLAYVIWDAINQGEIEAGNADFDYAAMSDDELKKMFEGCESLTELDLSSFNTSSLKEYPNQVRTISKFEIKKKKDLIIIRVTATGFLRNMVRIMVGTLIDLARGQKTITDVKDMLNHPRKGTRRYSADPAGLYLINIFF